MTFFLASSTGILVQLEADSAKIILKSVMEANENVSNLRLYRFNENVSNLRGVTQPHKPKKEKKKKDELLNLY